MTNVAITPGVGATIGTDTVAGVDMQRIKVDIGNTGAGLLWGSTVLADTTANPTVPQIGSFLHTFNGTTWDRSKSANAIVDGTGGNGAAGAANTLFNSATWDRQYNNLTGIALASAARTTTTNSATLTNFNGRGIMAWLVISAASGTGGLTLKVFGTDPASSNSAQLNTSPTAIIATGTYAYEIYPGSSTAGAAGSGLVQQRTAGIVPRAFTIVIGVGDASSYTYSVGYSVIL